MALAANEGTLPAGTTAFTFTVARTGGTSGAVNMTYAVTGSGVTPANAADFSGTLPTGSFTIPDTQASATLSRILNQMKSLPLWITAKI